MADLDPTVARAIKLVQSGKDEHKKLVRRYDKSYDIYKATAPNAPGIEPWQSKLRVKYAKQVVDTAMVNMVSGYPRVKVTPRHPEGEIAAKAMQYIMDYYVQEDHFVEKQPQFVLQSLVCGVTVAKNHWVYKTTSRPTKTYAYNMLDPSSPEVKTQMMDYIVKDGPTFEPWNVYQCYWEPGARDVDDAAYVVLQSYLSKDVLRSLAYNPATKKGLYHNVEELISLGQAPRPNQTAQDRALGFDSRTKDKFLIEEIWTDDELIVIGNNQILMRGQPNPYHHGHKPVVITSTQPDMFEIAGTSETELVDHLQQAQWTLQNATIDNLHLTVMRGITYREGGVTNPNDLELRPRFKWGVSDHDDIRPFEVQPIASDVFTERQRMLADMQLVTGINPYVSGSDLQSVDQNTATGVTALQDVASRLLRFKAAQVAYKGYQRTWEQWGDMIQQFMDKNTAVKIEGKGGDTTWLDISPEDVEGHFTYRLEGTEESLSRQQERGEAIALLNAFAPLAQLGIVNFQPILENIAEAYDFPNPESLLAAPPPPQQQASPNPQDQAAMQQAQQGQQGGQPSPQALQAMMQNVVGPRLGQVPQRNTYQQAGGLMMDPRLAAVLGQIGQQIPK